MPSEPQDNPNLIINTNCEVALSVFIFSSIPLWGYSPPPLSLFLPPSLDIYFLSTDGINIRDGSISPYDMAGTAAT